MPTVLSRSKIHIILEHVCLLSIFLSNIHKHLLLFLNEIEIKLFFQAHHHSHNFLQKNQIWEQFVSDNVQNEVYLLKSPTNIAETLLTEKTNPTVFSSTEFQKYWFNSWANPLHFVHCPKHTVPRFESFVGNCENGDEPGKRN